MLYLSISKSFILTFKAENMAFIAKLPSHCVFKVMQYGYKICFIKL